MTTAASATPVLERFGKYQLIKKLAAGGMGEVYLAKQQGPVGFEKTLVIKRMLTRHEDKQSYREMFFSEARVAALLSHSNVVQIFDLGEEDEHFYLAMEYVHGRSLRDVIDAANARAQPIPLQHILEILVQVCAGLHYAHTLKDSSGQPLQIVHRDITPQNLLVSFHGEVKIIDFGIAKSAINVHRTEAGTIKGKYVYMSPEQSAGEELDGRSDMFALGIVAYEMCTGHNPFHRNSVVETLTAVQREEPPSLEGVRPDVALLAPVVRRCLGKWARERFPDANELRLELIALQQSGRIPRAAGTLADYMGSLFGGKAEHEVTPAPKPPKAPVVQEGKTAPARARVADVKPPTAQSPAPVRDNRSPDDPRTVLEEALSRPAGGQFRHVIPVKGNEEDLFPDTGPTELEGDARVARAIANGAVAPSQRSSSAPSKAPTRTGLIAAAAAALLAVGGAVAWFLMRAP
ncbi:MAG: serine/threonine-protein kinase [Myxococcota bacterium]